MKSEVKLIIGVIGAFEIPSTLVLLPEVVGSSGLEGIFKFPFNMVTVSKYNS